MSTTAIQLIKNIQSRLDPCHYGGVSNVHVESYRQDYMEVYKLVSEYDTGARLTCASHRYPNPRHIPDHRDLYVEGSNYHNLQELCEMGETIADPQRRVQDIIRDFEKILDDEMHRFGKVFYLRNNPNTVELDVVVYVENIATLRFILSIDK